MKNPFVTNGYVSPEYFCDREKETEQLTTLLTNGNNVALISPRRIGKTDLIQHCFNQEEIKNNYHTFLIDIYSTKNTKELVGLFGRAILDGLRPLGRKAWDEFLKILTSIRQQITFDAYGVPSWSIGLGEIQNPGITLDEIFRYLREAQQPCIVAIDEFQQITKYNDGENVEALLRTHIQRCTNASFIFSGSQRHMMGEMFTSPSRPFYQSVTLFNLHPIPLDKYAAFCQYHFEKAGKHIEAKAISDLYDMLCGTTSYMQKVMNLAFQATAAGTTCTIADIRRVINEILDLSSDTYVNLMYQLPDKQGRVLKAIALEGEAHAINSSNFVKKWQLVSASSVASAAKGLLDRDLITQEGATYKLADKFLELWINRNHYGRTIVDDR